MTKKLMTLGTVLTKKQQQETKGGFGASPCRTARDCQFIFGPHINRTGDYSCITPDIRNNRNRICISNT